MDDDYSERANRLFAITAAMLEVVIEVAVAGRAPQQRPSQLADHGRRLQSAMPDIAVIAEAAIFAATPSVI